MCVWVLGSLIHSIWAARLAMKLENIEYLNVWDIFYFYSCCLKFRLFISKTFFVIFWLLLENVVTNEVTFKNCVILEHSFVIYICCIRCCLPILKVVILIPTLTSFLTICVCLFVCLTLCLFDRVFLCLDVCVSICVTDWSFSLCQVVFLLRFMDCLAYIKLTFFFWKIYLVEYLAPAIKKIFKWNYWNITIHCMVLLLDGNSEHVAHIWRKIGLFGKKKNNYIFSTLIFSK